MSSAAPQKFFVAVDDRASSVDALHEAVKLRHVDTHLSVVTFLEHGQKPIDAPDVPSRALPERFELYLTPRLAKTHWDVQQVRGLLWNLFVCAD